MHINIHIQKHMHEHTHVQMNRNIQIHAHCHTYTDIHTYFCVCLCVHTVHLRDFKKYLTLNGHFQVHFNYCYSVGNKTRYCFNFRGNIWETNEPRSKRFLKGVKLLKCETANTAWFCLIRTHSNFYCIYAWIILVCFSTSLLLKQRELMVYSLLPRWINCIPWTAMDRG